MGLHPFPDCFIAREALPTGQEHPSWSRHAYLCGACGEVSYADDWLAFKHNDEGDLIPNEDGESDPIIRCPICKTDHKDADDDTGVWAGTRKEMYAERDTQLQNPIIADAWIGFWKGRAEHPHQDVEREARDHFEEWGLTPERVRRRTEAAEQKLKERVTLDQHAAVIEAMADEEQRRKAAEQELERLREALTRIDNEVPSEEHWHRMGDAMWANIGRLAARTARAALAVRPTQRDGDD